MLAYPSENPVPSYAGVVATQALGAKSAASPAPSGAKGWLLSLDAQSLVAVGERELVHILAELPVLQRIPRAPAHARQAMLWQERIVPVIDLAMLIGRTGPALETASVIGVVAYRGGRKNAIELGALALRAVPRRIETSAREACDPPVFLQALEPWTLSCFEDDQHGAVPILNLSKLFAAVSRLAAEGGAGEYAG